MGRQAMGIQGQGKGRKMTKVNTIAMDDEFSDGDGSEDDFFGDEEDENYTPAPKVKRQVSSRKKTKKTRREDPDDDYKDYTDPTPPVKKAKRDDRTAYKSSGNDTVVTTTSKPSSRITGHRSVMSSSPLQPLEPVELDPGAHQSSYYATEHAYDPTTSLPSLQDFDSKYVPPSPQFGHWSQQSMGYPSVTNADFNFNSSFEAGGKSASKHEEQSSKNQGSSQQMFQ